MAKRPTISALASGYNGQTVINNNLTALRNGFDNTLSLDGSTPNAMNAELDMNNNEIVNVSNLYAADIIIEGTSLTGSVTAAAASAAAAATSASEASTSATSAATALDDFDDKYLGSKAANPALDNDGDALQTGALYWNSVSNEMLVYNGAGWETFGGGVGDLISTNNLSDVANAATARTNLGVAIGSDVQAYSGDNALLTSPAFTGTPTAPTPSAADNSTKIATTAYVDAAATTIDIATQVEAETGTDNTKLMTPLRVQQNFEVNEQQIGVGQTWQNVTRSVSTSYQNTTGRPIQLAVRFRSATAELEVSDDNSTWIEVGEGYENSGDRTWQHVIVPDQHYYRLNGGSAVIWRELR